MEAEDELVERQRKIRQLKATGIQEKHLLEWNFAVAEDNKDIQMAKLSLPLPNMSCRTSAFPLPVPVPPNAEGSDFLRLLLSIHD